MSVYAKKFQSSDAVARYNRKLANPIDLIRHDIELAILTRHARGKLFDCTIGTGRFIGVLPNVVSYRGFDISPEFVHHIRTAFPDVGVHQGDLLQGIPEPDNSFDCVICLRSLSAIGHLDRVLPEMFRIAAPGGTIVLDYGRKPTTVTLDGKDVVIDGEDFDGLLAGLDADVTERLKCDAVLTRLKKQPRISRFLNGRWGSFVPNRLLSVAEDLLAPLLWERQIVVFRKRGKQP